MAEALYRLPQLRDQARRHAASGPAALLAFFLLSWLLEAPQCGLEQLGLADLRLVRGFGPLVQQPVFDFAPDSALPKYRLILEPVSVPVCGVHRVIPTRRLAQAHLLLRRCLTGSG